jgi:hypothetical protein
MAEHGVGCELVSTVFPVNSEKYREFPDFSGERTDIQVNAEDFAHRFCLFRVHNEFAFLYVIADPELTLRCTFQHPPLRMVGTLK